MLKHLHNTYNKIGLKSKHWSENIKTVLDMINIRFYYYLAINSNPGI